MKTQLKNLLLVFLFAFNFSNLAKAQVANDVCSTATSLGVLLPGFIGNICLDGQPNYYFSDSTSSAVVNFPYPTIPTSCSGYTTSIGAPAKDLWYTFIIWCDLTFQVENSDTVHLSFWQGNDCSNLSPLACYTVPAGNTFQQTLGYGAANIFLQISGPNASVANTKFNICMINSDNICVPAYTTTPTPVTCFVYEATHFDCTTTGAADGIASISVTNGNAPFSILWSDGFNGFQHNNLVAGTYYYTITDVNGCAQSDSIIINNPLAVNEFSNVQNKFLVYYNSFTQEIDIQNQNTLNGTPVKVEVCDETGRIIFSDILLVQDEMSIKKHFSQGVYFLRIQNGLDIQVHKTVVR